MGGDKSIVPERVEAHYSFVYTLFSAQRRPFLHLGKAPIQSQHFPNCHLLRRDSLPSARSLFLSLADGPPKNPLVLLYRAFSVGPDDV